MVGANLFSADLTGARLSVASLDEAKLTLTVLAGADLRGTDLTGTRIHEPTLDGAIWDDDTQWPARRCPGDDDRTTRARGSIGSGHARGLCVRPSFAEGPCTGIDSGFSAPRG
jgi:Pentapeptide repeats (8 copies)